MPTTSSNEAWIKCPSVARNVLSRVSWAKLNLEAVELRCCPAPGVRSGSVGNIGILDVHVWPRKATLPVKSWVNW